MKRILSLLLAGVMMVSAVPVTYAADTNDHSLGTQVTYTAANNESYFITVPAALNPGQSGTVTLSGSWPDNKTVTVTADTFVKLTNSIKASDTKTLTVTFPGISEAGSNIAAQTFTETISVSGISEALFGSWSGKFNYNVNTTEEDVTPSENYIGTVSADNTITLSGVESAGTYTLRYANANGALENYADICSLEVTDPATAVSYDDLIAENCAPVEATSIAVYNAANEKVGDIALGGLKTNLGTKLYSFGAISDVHIGYETSNSDLRNALTYLSNTENVSFIGIAGDLTSSATDAQYTAYKTIVSEAASVPVYAITGNHDTANYRGSSVSSIIENYTGHPIYYSFTHGNDAFIMLGVEAEQSGAHLADGELQWLYETLEANKDKRCFVFTHVYPNNSSGDPSNIYGYDLWSGTEGKVFDSLLAHYPNLTVFHGHSHVEFALQAVDDTTNIHTAAGYNSIHIPSITAPRTGTIDGDSIMSNYLYEESEGYVVDVYENGIVLRGRDFVGAEFLPIAQYYISTPVSSVAGGTYSDSTGTIDPSTMFDGFSVNYNLSNATSSNATKKVMNGASFSTSIVPDWGYVIDEIRVTMGGTDISASVVSGSAINIPAVTGELVVAATTHYETINLVDIVGYQNNTRMSQSTGELKEQTGYATTVGYIELQPGDVFRISGLDFSTNEGSCLLSLYDKNYTVWTTATFGPNRTYPFNYPSDSTPALNIDCDENGALIVTVSENLFTNPKMNQARYFRICGYGDGANLVITKNQDLPEIEQPDNGDSGDSEIVNLVDTVGYQNDTRMSQSTGELKTQAGYTSTVGYIELEPGAVFRISGIDMTTNENQCMIMLFDANYTKWTHVSFGPDVTYPFVSPTQSTQVFNIDCDENGTIIVTVAEDLFTNGSMKQARYFRICGYGDGANLVITKD